MSTRAQASSLPAKRIEHSIEIRSMAVAFRMNNDSYRLIGKKLKLCHTTVESIISSYQETGSTKNKKRSGRPKKLTNQDVKILTNDVLKDRESCTRSFAGITLKLNSMLTTDVSETTVRCTLKDQGIKCHAAAVKPFVSEINAAKRVAWCQERLNWIIEDWE